jgi:hypothetical protein
MYLIQGAEVKNRKQRNLQTATVAAEFEDSTCLGIRFVLEKPRSRPWKAWTYTAGDGYPQIT